MAGHGSSTRVIMTVLFPMKNCVRSSKEVSNRQVASDTQLNLSTSTHMALHFSTGCVCALISQFWLSLTPRNRFIPVLEDAFSVHPAPTYATIMRLDTKVRDLPFLDPEALGLDVLKMTTGECMQLFCVGGMKELVLLYLHRRFLFIAVSDEQCDDISTHRYAYSVNAGLKAAVAMTRQTRGEFIIYVGAPHLIQPLGLFWKDPAMSPRLFFIWLHGFSGERSIFACLLDSKF